MPRVPPQQQQQQSTNMEEIKKGAWSPDEDQKLKSYILRYGIWNWSRMPIFAGLSRTGKSCRLRWMNYLRPDVKRGPFTMDEVQVIFKTYQELGNRWSAIAARLPGRTDNEIKNFFHTHLKKHLRINNKRVKKIKEKGSSENSVITYEEENWYNVVDDDQPMEIIPVILESNPETTSAGINSTCQLCQFEYPHPCTISDAASFYQFDLLWDAQHLFLET